MSAPTDTSHRDLMDRDKGLTPTPTARELLTLLGMEDTVETLAARVEAVLSLIDSRWQVPAEVIVAQIRRILDGEKP